MKYLFAENYRTNGKNAGSKARKDVENILKSMGFRKITLYTPGDSSILVILKWIKVAISSLFLVKRGAIIVFEHPYIPFSYSNLLSVLAAILKKIKGITSVIIIHDLTSARMGTPTMAEEVKCLNRYDYIICHNQSMKTLLLENGCNSIIKQLKVFDYLVDNIRGEIFDGSKADLYTVSIAGNLTKDKSGYIYELANIGDIKFNLYGQGVDETILGKNVSYIGTFGPEELPSVMRGAWGLVWDGDSISTCNGKNGEYLRINNPHKLSLYLACGLPVITWDKAAIAQFIVDYEIGITVKSLRELPQKIKTISADDYSKMQKNVFSIRKKIINGEYLKTIIEDIGNKND